MKIKYQKSLTALVAVLIFVSVLVILRNKATNSVAHGIVIQGEGSNLGGVKYERLSELLEDYFLRLNQKQILLNLDGQTATVTLSELGVELNSNHTLEKIRTLSYGNSLATHYGMRLVHLFTETEIQPVHTIDQKKLISTIQTKFPILQGAINSEIGYDEQGNPFVIPHQDQLTTDFLKVSQAIPEIIAAPGNIYTINLQTTADVASYRTEQVEKDIEILQKYLHKEVIFTITPPTEEEKTFTFKTTIAPNWLQIQNQQLKLDHQIIESYLQEQLSPQIEKEVQNAIIKSLPAEGSNFAEVEGVAQDGRKIDYQQLLDQLTQNLQQDNFTVEIPIQTIPSKIENQTGINLGELENLGTGKSGFWGSAPGRKANIHKGLNEKVNNILVAPGAEYSFNSNLGPVTRAAGWYNADAIFNGDELIPVPGGGLCQVSTTVYRAALQANMEILERSPHSLYVLYYEEFGNGLDSAIYPGHKDLRFRNTTNDYVLIQSYVENDYGYVNIFGTPTGDKVELLGPIYSGRVPEEFKDLVNPRWNQISWIKKVTKPDGTFTLEPINSSYRTAPRKLYPYQSPAN